MGSPTDLASLANCPFKLSPTGFTYLGIKFSPDLTELWKLNFSPIVTKIKKDLDRWYDLPLSFMGCIKDRHLTPYILNKMDRQISPLCNKCHREFGTFYHYFWQCKLIKRFWGTISQELSGIFQVKMRKDPGLFILGLGDFNPSEVQIM